MLFFAGVLTTAVGAAVAALFGYLGTNREMDVKMVEIAVGILAQDPKDSIAPAREWAVDVISYYAEVTPSDAVRKALVEYKVVTPSHVTGISYSYSYDAFVPDAINPSVPLGASPPK